MTSNRIAFVSAIGLAVLALFMLDGAEAARFNNELKENLGKNFAYKLAI